MIQVRKGQHIALTEQHRELSHIKVCLGWDQRDSEPEGGFIKRFFGGGSKPNFDCDASVLMLNAQNKLAGKKDAVYYGHLKHESGSVRHSGDNLTGEGDGDDEVIFVDLPGVPSYIHRLLFVVTVFHAAKRGQDFAVMSNAFIRVVRNDTQAELMRFNLSENYGGYTTLMVAELYRESEEWKFAAIGEGAPDASIGEVIKRFQ